MLTLADFRQRTVPLAIPIEVGTDPETGQPVTATLTVRYRAHAYDRAMEEELNALSKRAGEDELILAEAKIAVFCRVVAEWDLRWTADDPEPVPITPEGLREVPLDLIDVVMEAIRADRAPKPPTTTSS